MDFLMVVKGLVFSGYMEYEREPNDFFANSESSGRSATAELQRIAILTSTALQ